MNDTIKDKLKIIANDDFLLTALKAIFDERIEKERPTVGDIKDNQVIGEQYRAYEKAKDVVDKTFQDLNNYKLNRKPTKGFHKEL